MLSTNCICEIFLGREVALSVRFVGFGFFIPILLISNMSISLCLVLLHPNYQSTIVKWHIIPNHQKEDLNIQDFVFSLAFGSKNLKQRKLGTCQMLCF